MSTRLVVIACGARKGPEPIAAGYLYEGSLFKAARKAALASGQDWMILSAKYGLLDPRRVIAPYEATIRTQADKRALAVILIGQHKAYDGREVEAWVPHRYVEAMYMAGVNVTAAPLTGLGIGQQMKWFADYARDERLLVHAPRELA
jgi:hypothetical protein